MRRIFLHKKNGSLDRVSSKKIVYLIGLPGVGKTTVGNIIAKRTGFVLLDHNITYKEVCRFLPKGTQKAHLLNGRLHLVIMDLLLHSVIPGAVCTMSIRRYPTYQTIKRAVSLIKQSGAQVYFVKIKCDWEEHQLRISMPSRRGLTKTNTVQKLKKYMAGPCFEGLKNYPPLIIDNTKMPAYKCAEKIISTLKLSTSSRR